MMSQLPWDTDRQLDAFLAARIISAQFPRLAPVSLEFLGSGWDNDAYLVNAEWVFRFPRRANAVSRVQREIAIMPVIAEAVDLPVPEYEFVGEADDLFPYLFGGYRILPGTRSAAVQLTPQDHPVLAKQLGKFFTQLHSIPAHQLPPGDEKVSWTQSPAERLAELVEVADSFRAAVGPDVAKRWESWLHREVTIPPAYCGPLRLTHNDLGDDHLLLDAATRRAVGVIDWADSALGDPCVDFIFLHHWLGADFIKQVLEYYELPLDSGFRERLQFFTTVTALIWTADSYRMDDAVEIRRWVDWFVNVSERSLPGWPNC